SSKTAPIVGTMELTPVEKLPVSKSTTSSTAELEPKQHTDWNAVVIASLVTFLSAVETTVVGMSEWPYMHTIDRDATSQFFGLVSSVSKFGHAVFAVVFAFWAYRTHSVKVPLIVGRGIAFFSCCVYLCVEMLPSDRRYLMLFCYFLFGVAASSSTVLRAYIVAVSSTEDRAKAYSAIAVANMISIVIGPLCQLAFSNMPYPGHEIIEGVLKFHIYSAPIWIASATNFISVAIIWFGLRDVYTATKRDSDGAMFTLEGIKARINVVLSLNLAWALIVVCWIERIVSNISTVTLSSIMSPLVMISFGWDGQLTVKMLALCMGLVGILALGVAASFFFCKKLLSPRVAFLVALAISVVMYLLTYPFQMTSHKMQPYNETSGAGCNPNEYSWCDTAYATWPVVFLPIICAVMGVGVPLAGISLDTVYSKVLGNIDQSMMQGAMIVSEDIVYILGPVYAA
ncbi:hypothetical protein V3C99_011645, partial [Haemonchus contortus]|uniref:Membrane transporter n=1 Tax=Haemonchus contortus TaxID=6289 RepID=A0A7I4Y643_HAECO